MSLKYVSDPEGTYEKSIMDGLVEYNVEATHSIRRERRYLYVFQGEKMVAGAIVSFGWDWIHLIEYFYESKDALLPLLQAAFEPFRREAVGSILSVTDPDMVEDFKRAGYDIVGRIKDMPKGGYRTTLVNTSLERIGYKGQFRIMISHEPIETFEKIFKCLVGLFEKRHLLKDENEQRFSYVCLGQDEFVGGIVGKIMLDNLYIDLLFVDRNYRKRGIATKLMELAEQKAKENGITQAYLGTGSFQAPGLYRKLGYEIVMTIEDFPRNFQNHTLVKTL